MFTLNGGVISGNTVIGSGDVDGGGGVYTAGKFTMNAGTISGNDVPNRYAGGVLVSGNGAEFTMESGTLSGNKANYGGGVHISSSGTVTINGGTIGSGNTAFGGGGLSMSGGKFTIDAGVISNNTAKYGGGAYITGGELIMNNGTKLSGNKANDGGDGGGVYLGGGKFTMNNTAALANNAAEGNGGGVFLNKGEFTMSGGSISSNTANKSGSCVYVGKEGGGGTMTLNGAVTITSNKDSNVFLADGKTITIGSGFSTANKIGIHPETPPNNCQAVVPVTTFAGGVTATDISDKFKPDLAKQNIIYEGNQVKLMGEHSFNTAWEKDDTGHWHICTVCNTEVDKAAHRWDKGKVTKQPTSDEAGEITYTCLDCAHTKTAPITLEELNKLNTPARPSGNRVTNDNDYDYDKNTIPNNPPTGISLSLAPPVLAIAAIAALMRKRK